MTRRRNLFLLLALAVFAALAATILLSFNYVANENSLMLKAPANIQESQNVLRWGAVEGAKEYRVQINGKTYNTAKNELSLETLEPGEYTLYITAVSANGEKYNSIIEHKLKYLYSGLTVVAKNITVSKIYDGTTDNDIEIAQGTHYEISGLKYGTNVDIKIESTSYNSADVGSADTLVVKYSATLTGTDADKYKIEQGKVEIRASIAPKEIAVKPPKFTKQFLDKDILKEKIEVDGKQLECSYTRTEGEEIGTYDLIGAALSDANYSAAFDSTDGAGKFQIVKRMLEVAPLGKTVGKVYDGTKAYESAQIKKGEHYQILRLVSGFDANITVVSAQFDSQNVSDCSRLTVSYSAVLQDANSVYEITEGQFECEAFIDPKSVSVLPQRFTKQFGDKDELIQQVQDGAETFDVRFLRAGGEAVGKYDLTHATADNKNFAPSIIAGSGKDKFEIIRRVLEVLPVTNAKIEKVYDGNASFNEPLVQGKHYTLHNIVSGYNAEIKITAIVFNGSSIAADSAAVFYENELTLGGEHYALIRGSFTIGAAVTPKIITLDVPYINKQFGDSDATIGSILVEETNERVEYALVRAAGEAVGDYNVLSAESTNQNYVFAITGGDGKFRIDKRTITVTPTGAKLGKEFNNNAVFAGSFIEGSHYTVDNLVNGFPITIHFFNGLFNDKTTAANRLSAELQIFSDCYVLSRSSIAFDAEITKKRIEFEPTEISVQYGDQDHLQSFVIDGELNVTVDFVYTRQSGNNAGSYDLLGANSLNENYVIGIKSGSGTGKYIILARKLNVKIIDGVSFTKIYDNSAACNSPILQGFHYELENLIGGSDVNLRILSKQYNSKNALEATKVVVAYSAILAGADGANYETTQGVFEFPASITAKIISIEPYKFVKRFSESESLTQNYYDEATGETVSAYFTRQAGEAVRVYDILSADSRNDNFGFIVTGGEGKFEIIRNNITITAHDKTARFNKAAQGIAQPVSLPVKDLLVEYRLIGQTQFAERQPVNAGQYEVRISFAGDDGYNALTVYKSLSIERIESIITDNTPKNYTYDGTAKKVVAHLNHDETPLIFSANEFVRAGRYNNILISAPQTTNYKASSILVSLEIAKYIVSNSEISYPTPASITYGQFLFDSALPSNSKYGAFEWANGNTVPPVNNSGYIVRFVPFDTDNYDFGAVALQKLTALNVQKAKVALTPPLAEKINYGGKLSSSALLYTCPYGSFAWQNGNEVLTSGGNYCKAIFTPYDTENYDWSEIPSFYDVLVEVYFPITFDVLGGNIMPNLLVDILLSAPPATKKGYVFEGWYLDPLFAQAVVYPYSVTAPVNFYALWRTRGLSFTLDSAKGGYIVGFDGEYVQSLAIPASYKGKPVVAVADNAFVGNYTLKYVTVPLSVKTLGTKAFYNCRNLLEIHLGENIENLQLGEDWNKTMGSIAADVHFECKPCIFCSGTIDCHVDCPYCAYCGNENGGHNACVECGTACDGSANVKFCLTCGKCNACVQLCPGCGQCVACNQSSGQLVCGKCHWCNTCNAENGFEYCIECGNCNSCYTYCAVCKKCETHCKCVPKRKYAVFIKTKEKYCNPLDKIDKITYTNIS